MDKEKHIQNVIQRKSKDEDYGVAIIRFLEMLQTLRIEYAVMGSAGLQTFLPYFHRLPNDLDITLSQNSITLIEDYCKSQTHLSFEGDFVASRVLFQKGFSLHLIPEQMNWVDRSTNVVFDKYQVFHRDRLEQRPIRFVQYDVNRMVPVHCIEYSYCLYVTQRMDCNIYHDCEIILKKFEFDENRVFEFFNRVPVLKSVFQHRFLEHKRIVSKLNPELIPKLEALCKLLTYS